MNIEIDEKDAHYLMKLIRNGRDKAEAIIGARPNHPLKSLWEETIKANERLERALENATRSIGD